MGSKAMVQLALQLLSCNQKELAVALKVSPTQVSKWKAGEYISFEMESALRKLIGIGDKDPELILHAGGIDPAAKWERLISYLAAIAESAGETGYNTSPLVDETELLCGMVFQALVEMGIQIPKPFPKELNIDLDNDELAWDAIERNPIASLIYEIFRSYTDIYGFYAAYVSELLYDDALDLDTSIADNIESSLIALAASKLDVDEALAKEFREYRYVVQRRFEGWIEELKAAAFRARVPLRAELMDMILKSHGEVGHRAERESLGFNRRQLHPDIYMNELLVGMRLIHQVLPAIMEKLGIKEDFVLDQTDLHLS